MCVHACVCACAICLTPSTCLHLMVVVESPELVGCSEAEPGGATAMRGNGLKDDYTFV